MNTKVVGRVVSRTSDDRTLEITRHSTSVSGGKLGCYFMLTAAHGRGHIGVTLSRSSALELIKMLHEVHEQSDF